MPLRSYQPISRAAGWTDTVRWIDPRTRQPQSLAGATLSMALYPDCNYVRRDYGRLLPGLCNALVTATTQADGSGPFVILADGVTAQWTFPAGALSNLWPGDALLIVWATVTGQTDEITRATIQVLDGPLAVPGLPVSTPAPVDPGITVIVDGGTI